MLDDINYEGVVFAFRRQSTKIPRKVLATMYMYISGVEMGGR